MKLYVLGPDTDTHLRWVNSQPRQENPNDWNSPVTPVPITDGVLGTWTAPFGKSVDFPLSIDFVLSISGTLAIEVAAHLVVEWIMSNFKGHAEKITVERTEVTFDRGELTKIVTETIKSERGE